MASLGAQGLPQMPDFSSTDPFSTAGDMKLHLQNLLDSKEKQLQQAGSLGQRVLAQQMELEERIRQIQELETDKGEDDVIDIDARERYRELADTLLAWDDENAQLSSAFGNNIKRFLNGGAHSPVIQDYDLPREEPERTKPAVGSSAAQSRRAKNAAHRADDVEFAFEIGSGLLTEVRRLQSLLGERDKAIQDMKEEKDDLDRIVESLRTTIRQNDKMIDELRSTNWDLEVNVRDLQGQVTDSQASIQRLESEHKRLTKSLTAARDSGDQQKNESERLQAVIEDLKAKHETDVAQARKHAAGLARDKSDLQQTVDTLKAEAARAARRIPRFGSPLTPGGADKKDFLTPAHNADGEDVFGTTGRASTNRRNLDVASLFPPEDLGDFDHSPDPSPVRKPFLAANHPSNEIEALQQRLAHAQRQINTLKGSLNREKQLRMKLEGSSGPVAEDEDEMGEEGEEYVDENTAVTEVKGAKRTITPFKVGRGSRGRGRGGITLIQRLAAAANYDDDNRPEESPPPPIPAIPSQYGQLEEDDEVSQFFGSNNDHSRVVEDEQEEGRSPSPPPVNSNRTSVDGMDPAFANVLRRVPSNGSTYTGSPLRQAILGRSVGRGRRPRGGVPFKEARPPSIVDAPEVLATELGGIDPSPFKSQNTSLLNDADIIEEVDDGEEYIRVKKVEKVEFGCQTELIEDKKTFVMPVQPVVHAAPAVEHADIGIQSGPEPAPVKPITANMGLQTVSVSKFNVATQHDPPKSPVRVSNGVGTDPLPEEPSLIVRGLPPIVTGDLSRKATIKQADISRSSTAGDTTVTRTFLAERHAEEDEDEVDEGEETETGADTEDDYLDARQSMQLSTPSEDYHSMLTMTENYSDSEDDAESIKASRFSTRGQSSTSLHSLETVSSYNSMRIVKTPAASYESIGVGADLYQPPSPIVIETPILLPKPEVKEMSIQTDEWKPRAPVVPVPPPKSPTLIRVGSGGHQFQFITPPSPSSINGPSLAPVFTAPSPVPTPLSSIFREPPGTLGRRITASDRRQSIDSMVSSGTGAPSADEPIRSRVPSSAATSILLNSSDKSKPPMVSLPPPPKAPPPPNSMLPPAFIPERRTHSDGPPPRPSSPPPAELIQRATTPLGSILSVPGTKVVRIQGSSMPPSQTNIRQLPSTSSFRSAAHAGSHTFLSSSQSSYNGKEREKRERSTISLASDVASPRSSISSDHHLPYSRTPGHAPSTPNKSADVTPRAYDQQATDPAIIHAITQTMIGEFMWKYTRKTIGKGVGERRHKRFFWVHPYTKTLYWSSADPGSSNVSESSAKSAYVEGVRSVLDPNPMPPGLYQYSVVVSTPHREMKITAPTKERHEIWLNALKYLLARPSNPVVTSPANNTILPQTPSSGVTDDDRRLVASPQSQRSARTPNKGETWNTTPRGKRSRSQLSVGGSISKRTGTAAVEYMRWSGPESPYSPERSFVDIPTQDPDDLDFELHDESMSEEAYEGLENVRACCDGRHTVGHSAKHHHHHHNNHHHHYATVGTINSRRSVENQHLEPMTEQARPSSPAWSFRSRTGSSHGHGEGGGGGGGGGGGLFSWGRGEDGKLRFGSRRSTKASVPAHD